MRQTFKRFFQLRYIIAVLYMMVIVTMAIATLIEHQRGSEYVSENIYGAWWFCLLWSLLAAGGIALILKMRLRRIPTLMLHLSFVLILVGALITHVFAQKGMIHLRLNVPVNEYLTQNSENDEMNSVSLPFTLTLTKFEIAYGSGTDAVQNYYSNFIITDHQATTRAQVSMNHIFSYRGIRFYQNSYDNDNQGTYLSINSDPYGIAISYVGYALLFLSFLFLLLSPQGRFRKVLRNSAFRKSLLLLIFFVGSLHLLFAVSPTSAALSSETARDFGKLLILYNGRICPLQTFSLDFVQKVHGSHSYRGFSSEQVLLGWIFSPNKWDSEPLIHVKNHQIRKLFHLSAYTSLQSFFGKDGYLLAPLTENFYRGESDQIHRAAVDLDARIQLILSLRQGDVLKIFPCRQGLEQRIVWYPPTAILPSQLPAGQQLFVHNVFSLLNQDVQRQDEKHFNLLLQKIKSYQMEYGGKTIPSSSRVEAEYIYNAIPFATVLFMLNLTMGFLCLGGMIYRLSRMGRFERCLSGISSGLKKKWLQSLPLWILIFSFLSLSCCLLLRWLINGSVPMANGYETMLLLAWFVMLLTLVSYRRFHLMLTFGFLLSGFFLLVSHISQMDPQITPIMPVLHSPLLSIHVSVIMMSFALLSVTFICAVMALMVHVIDKESELPTSLQLLSQLFLYPALALLAAGIFIGAVWANVSWGQYWSWDPKEVWALITLMCYAVAVHTKVFPIFLKPMAYHIFLVFAFLTILMTYFGVNYFLGGMHSYA